MYFILIKYVKIGKFNKKNKTTNNFKTLLLSENKLSSNFKIDRVRNSKLLFM